MLAQKREERTKILATDKRPFVPSGWELGPHRPNGILEWGPVYNPAQLIQHELQATMAVTGMQVLRAFGHRRLCNANVLDHLISDPTLYPENWKEDETGREMFVTFLGTLYMQPHDRPWFRYLYWDHSSDKPVEGIVELSARWHGKRTYAATLRRHAFEREGAIG